MTVDINLFASVARASNAIYLYTKLDDDLQTITAPGYFNSKDLSGAVKVGDIILVNARDKFAVLKVIEVKVLSGEITVIQAFSEGGVVPPEPTPDPGTLRRVALMPTPHFADKTMNGVEGGTGDFSIQAPVGSTIEWSTSAEGWEDKSGEYEVNDNDNQIISPRMTPLPETRIEVGMSVEGMQEDDYTVSYSSEAQHTVEGNTLSIPPLATFRYEVSAAGMDTITSAEGGFDAVEDTVIQEVLRPTGTRYAWVTWAEPRVTVWTDSPTPSEGDPVYASADAESASDTVSSTWGDIYGKVVGMQSVNEGDYGRSTVNDVVPPEPPTEPPVETVHLTLYPQPWLATTTIDGVEGNTADVPVGTTVNYTCSLPGWTTATGTFTAVAGGSSASEDVYLEPTNDSMLPVTATMLNKSDYTGANIVFNTSDQNSRTGYPGVSSFTEDLWIHVGETASFEAVADYMETIHSRIMTAQNTPLMGSFNIRPYNTKRCYVYDGPDSNPPYDKIYTENNITFENGETVYDASGNAIGEVTTVYSGTSFISYNISVAFTGDSTTHLYRLDEAQDIIPPTRVYLIAAPERATRYLDGVQESSKIVNPGDVVEYEATLANWASASGTYTVQNGPVEQYIYANLEPTPTSTLVLHAYINNVTDVTNPNILFTTSDPNPVISQDGSSIEVLYNSTVNYTITADNMETYTSATVKFNNDDLYTYVTMRPTGTLYAYKAGDWDQDPPYGARVYTTTQTPQAGDNIYDNQGAVLGQIDSVVITGAGCTNTISLLDQSSAGHEYYREIENDILPVSNNPGGESA